MLSRNQQHLDVDTPRRDPEANVQGYQPPLGSLGFLSEILLIPDVHCEKNKILNNLKILLMINRT